MTASQVFHIPFEEVTDLQNKKCKNLPLILESSMESVLLG